MKIVRVFLIVCSGLLIGLGGCNSFNTVVGYNDIYSRPHTHQDSTNHPGGNNEPPPPVCPAYELPVLPHTPVLPYRDLAKIKPDDVDAIEQMERRHIQELRMYIMKVQQILIKSQKDYLTRCQAYAQKKTP